jgi:hypothetical protein
MPKVIVTKEGGIWNACLYHGKGEVFDHPNPKWLLMEGSVQLVTEVETIKDAPVPETEDKPKRRSRKTVKADD